MKAPESNKCSHDDVSLSEVGCGVCVRITQLTGDADMCRRLREMGLCEHESVRKVADHGALICDVKNSRVAISQHIAKNIKVSQSEPTGPRT